MIVCVSAAGRGLEAAVDPRFGRCGFFAFIDTETLEYRCLANPGASSAGGAGPEAARFIAGEGAEAVITGQVGPNALTTLNGLAIRIYETSGGTVGEAVDRFKEGSLKEILDRRVRF
ncbi:MAG: NifB/NifX family molybdenum-iron cluster-binding protein [Deltaproteobacteria bacterium]|nr:NifB/NifX family molybdenum-iron cluster-binding protein [Deltaproteobacteria bacterium]MBW2122640.1 NifB/NifX family molybdenum-iron cluster-binding protein [Deltaproteobacteria bacterium]